MLEFIRKHIVLDIVVLSMGLFVYFMIPSLDIIQLIADFQAYSANHTSVESINKLLSDLVQKQQEFKNFFVLIKFFVSLIVTIVLFLLSYFYYTQQEFQEKIEELRKSSEEKIKELRKSSEQNFTDVGSKIVGIDNTLKEHFEDYAELVKYNSFAGNKIIHHSFDDALKYDVGKINSLKQGQTYKSTVILKESYIEGIRSNEPLKNYITELEKKAENDEVTVTRIFITDHTLNDNEKQHLSQLKGAGIDVRIIKHDMIKKIKEDEFLREDISDNFIIINETEVAFSYPHDGFRFAVNLIDDDKNDQVKYICNSYKNFFNKISEHSKVFNDDK